MPGGGETGNSSSKDRGLNSIKYLFSFDAYKLQDRDVSVPKLGTFAFQAQCFQIKELSDPRKTL